MVNHPNRSKKPTFRITLNNSGGELDFFDHRMDDPDSLSEVATALAGKLEMDWCALNDGDTITIRQLP